MLHFCSPTWTLDLLLIIASVASQQRRRSLTASCRCSRWCRPIHQYFMWHRMILTSKVSHPTSHQPAHPVARISANHDAAPRATPQPMRHHTAQRSAAQRSRPIRTELLSQVIQSLLAWFQQRRTCMSCYHNRLRAETSRRRAEASCVHTGKSSRC